jgi:hypothetical protein
MRTRGLVVWSTVNGNRSFGHCPATDDDCVAELVRRYDGGVMGFESRYRWLWTMLSVSVRGTARQKEDAC